MSSRWRSIRGFTGVELLVVIVVIGILGGAAVGTHVYLQRRAIERVVVGDLDAYAQAQTTLRDEQGRFGPDDQLAAAGFTWTEGVEVRESRIVDDRFFVRVRHARTGFSCSLDLSPVTGRARNRKVCRDTESDPALAEPPGIVIGHPVGDTASVARPPSSRPGEETFLLPPVVGDVGEVVVDPGASRVVEFPVTNRSGEARTFRFYGSTANPAIVPEPVRAADARLEAGETAPIPQTVAVASGAIADRTGDVEFRAVDVGDRAYSATGVVRVRAALVLRTPDVAAPPPETRQPGESFTVEYRVRNRTNAARVFSLAPEIPPGSALSVDVMADQRIDAFEERVVPVTYRLDEGAEGGTEWTSRLVVADREAPAYARTSEEFRVTAAIIIAAPVLGRIKAQSVLPSQAGVGTTTVTSRSNVPREYCFTATVQAGTVPAGDVVAPAPAAPECLRVGPYQAVQVSQAFSVAAGAGNPWTNLVSVRAHDVSRPDLAAAQSFQVTAGLLLLDPSVEVPATPPLVAWRVDQERTIEYPVTNRSNAARELCLAVLPGGPELVAVEPGPVCAVVGPRRTYAIRHTLRGGAPGESVVSVTARDRLAPEHAAGGAFGARVADARPVAVWTPPSPVYVRRWVDFDAGRSFSPVGARIAKYVWSWGLINQRWTGMRFEPAGSGVATDELSTPTARRAWDLRGTFEVCLSVEDEGGRRSDPSCAAITALAETRARLAFRYRGWWYDPSDWCFDVPWDNQCPQSHGNARWEILLNHSQGDVPIRRAWANVRVDYWQTDDEFERSYTYGGNVETLPYSFVSGGQTITYDFYSNRHKADGSVASGRWRILDTDGTAALGWPQSPLLQNHPLVLNANLGRATGLLDGGPHWVPDEVWITLFVEDAHGKVTQQSRYLDHKRAEWRGEECINGTSGWLCTKGYERLVPPAEAPVVSILREDRGDWTYRYTGSGESPEGRIIDRWWEVTRTPFNVSQGDSRTAIHREEALQLRPEMCELVDVALVYVDDLGQEGRAWGQVGRIDPRTCVDGGAPR